MKLYGTPPTRALRVVWLLNELNIECEVVTVNMGIGEHLAPEFLALNPAGKLPALVDGDPVDVLVVTPFPVVPGVVVRCRPVGMLAMTDEEGGDTKLLAVPIEKLSPLYRRVGSPQDFAPLVLDQIQHFFAHYKDLEPGKWVRIEGWKDADAAKREILLSVERYGRADPKPVY